jgi:hypothetical protein
LSGFELGTAKIVLFGEKTKFYHVFKIFFEKILQVQNLNLHLQPEIG